MFAVAGLLFATQILAQTPKKPLDHDVYDGWQSVSAISLSDDGDIAAWCVNPQEGDGTLYVRKRSQAVGITIPRGYQATLDPAGKWLVCKIKPQFEKTRSEKIAKKKDDDRTKDTLAVVNLADMTVAKYGSVESFATGSEAIRYVAYKNAVKKDQMLIILDPVSGRQDSIANVSQFIVSPMGDLVAYTTKKEDKKAAEPKKTESDSTKADSGVKPEEKKAAAMVVASYIGGRICKDTLASNANEYSKMVFSDDQRMMAFLATVDSNKTGSKSQALWLMKNGVAKELIKQGTAYVYGMTLTENSVLYFTPDGRRIMTGIARPRPPKDTTIVDFETARVDIWNWDAPYTPPQQKKRLDQIVKQTFTSAVDPETGILTPLTTDRFESVSLLDGGKSDWALVRNTAKYIRASVWEDNSYSDVSLVSLKDGSRRIVRDSLNGSAQASPQGRYLYWFDNDDRDWHTYEIATGKEYNLTENLGVNFFIEDDDHPTANPGSYGRPMWIQGDQAILVNDRYDIWKIAADGSSAECLTQGKGREAKDRFTAVNMRTVRLTDNQLRSGVKSAFDPKGGIWFKVFGEEDSKNGFGRISLQKGRRIPSRTGMTVTDGTYKGVYSKGEVSYTTAVQAAKSDVIYFQKGDFRNPYDLYETGDNFATAEKLTSINPQISDYRWGRAEMLRWNAYDGTPLKGLVFIPDDIRPGEKLPVMIYFYEKYSESLYNHWNVAPSRSTVNIPLFMSRGYVVFVPDIVYKDGHPGESFYNCVCSGAEALCEKYSFADKSRMAIQGQSWGGYQTAWLVTRTDMFAAAGAGAPVSNMTSAYGGIRWESGMTRAGQYEHGQSRIGKSLWDEGALDLYIENSPIFHADKVKTPLLIMHNDADGAVPWYQGIEYFSNLRRLGKPCWLLQYNDEAHNLLERRNCKDLSKRLTQFFDHYLKGEPMPAWMKTGVPTDLKEEYFGFEYAE